MQPYLKYMKTFFLLVIITNIIGKKLKYVHFKISKKIMKGFHIHGVGVSAKINDI